MITGSDIVFVLSGGSTNTNPYASIGGEPSTYAIQGSLNNLFPNVTKALAYAGDEDYRCIYVFNNSETDSLWESELYVASQIESGSTVAIGVQKATDVQKVELFGVPSGGSFTLLYEEEEFIVNYDANRTTFATNFKTALVATGLISSDIIVTPTLSGSNLYFTVSFIGEDNYRYHTKMELVSNNLTDTEEIEITKLSNGLPINSIAPTLPTERTSPDVTFETPSFDVPISIGTLKPGEGFPVWIRRTTPPLAAAIESDGFTLTLKGLPVEP